MNGKGAMYLRSKFTRAGLGVCPTLWRENHEFNEKGGEFYSRVEVFEGETLLHGRDREGE